MTTRVMKRRPSCDGHLLYPLSYGFEVENPAGFEPATWRGTACSSIGIRHGPGGRFSSDASRQSPAGTLVHKSMASMAFTHWSG